MKTILITNLSQNIMNVESLINVLQDTETIIFHLVDEDFVPGVGIDFFVDLGKFNMTNKHDIELFATFTSENSFDIHAKNDAILDGKAFAALMKLFRPYFYHGEESNVEFRAYLKDKNLLPK